MSHYMTALAMKQKGLKSTTKIVLYWIADHHNGETGRCFPSLNRLADCAEMDKSTVVRHIDILVDFGLVERKKTYRDDGGFTSTSYILNLQQPLSQNTTSPSCNSAPPLVAKCDTNLGSNNQGSINLNILIERFDEFYAAYPIKKGKGAAKKAWEKAVKKADPDHIISNAALYASSVQNKDPKFIAHPATWLNAERWDDDISKEVLQAAIDPQNMMLDVLKSMGLKYNA